LHEARKVRCRLDVAIGIIIRGKIHQGDARGGDCGEPSRRHGGEQHAAAQQSKASVTEPSRRHCHFPFISLSFPFHCAGFANDNSARAGVARTTAELNGFPAVGRRAPDQKHHSKDGDLFMNRAQVIA
jgi:hypothetical protein